MDRLKVYEDMLAALKIVNTKMDELHLKSGLTMEEADLYFDSVRIHARLLVMYTNKVLYHDKKTI